jgi:translocation and assembly module TamB
MSAPPPRAARPAWARWLRVLSALLGAGLLALLLAAWGLWWWSAREGSLATALAWGGRVGLQAQDISGSLRRGGRIGQLRWQHSEGGMRVLVQQAQMRWDLAALLRGAWQGERRIHLQTLQAELLRLEPPPSAGPGRPPESLQLPLELWIDHLALQRLQWAGPTALELQDLDSAYRFTQDLHHLDLRQARYAQGSYQGQARLQASGALRLEAELRGQLQSALPGSAQQLSLNLQARLSGPLQQLQLQASLKGAGQTGQGSQAQLQARLAPWQDPPLPEAQARFQQLDLAALWPQAPRTLLSGEASMQPAGQRWLFQTRLANGASGPWNQGRLPVDQLFAQGQWHGGQLLIEQVQARLGAGRAQGRGSWMAAGAPEAGWQVEAQVEGLNAALIDSRWPAHALQGRVRAEQALRGAQALRFEAQLRGPPGAQPWQLLEGQAQGRWQGGQLSLDHLLLRSPDAQLQGSGQFRPDQRSGQGQARLSAPGLQAELRAAWPLRAGAGALELKVSQAQDALRWLRSLPPLPQALAHTLSGLRAQGQAELRLTWDQGLEDAQAHARLDLPVVEAPGLEGGRDWRASAQGRLTQMQLQAQGRLERGSSRWSASLRGEAALPGQALAQALSSGAQALQARIALSQLALQLQDPKLGAWQLENARPVLLQAQLRAIRAEPGELRLQAPRADAPALLAWQELSWQDGELRTSGRLRGLPLAWADRVAGPWLTRAGMAGDLMFDGRWELQLGQSLRAQAELQRSSGDLSLHAETGQGLATRMAAGVREARLSLSAEDQTVALGWRWDSERAGQSEGQLRTRLARSPQGWSWPAEAALSGQLQASLPRLGVWSALAPPGWRLRGSLQTRLTVAGTRAEPLLSGPLTADDLALRSVVDGIELGRGRLRSELQGQTLSIQEFSLQGPGAEGGSLLASGQASWRQGEPPMSLQASLSRLRVSVREDRQLTLSGQLQASLQGLPTQRPAQVTGVLRVDRARIRLPDEDRPQLGADVRVRRSGQPATPAATAVGSADRSDRPAALKLAVRLELGEDVAVEGKGLNARLRGALAVSADSFSAPPRLVGSITTASGEYRAYGQRLEIERGLLRFTGPADNPALDILAVRPNLAQKVGVQVTGTALLPRVRLYAEPELPEAEKLAWLVLGRSGAAGGAEAAVLQQAALALLGQRSPVNRAGLAASLGLDELSLRGAGQSEGGATGGAIAFGKRLSNNAYAIYESSLSGALGTLYLFYELSQRLTVRAQAGAQTAIDLIFTVPYD